MGEPDDVEEFRAFMLEVEPRLQRGLVALYGADRGREAAAEALAYAWERWATVKEMDNPVAYLVRVGRSRTRLRKVRLVHHRPESPDVWVEPQLQRALSNLPRRQRAALLLLYGADFTVREAAQALGVSASTVQLNAERGLARLRRALGVVEHG